MKTYFVDSFTNQKFKGNPAAVCLCEHDLEPGLMQNIATEIGFSETAFIKQLQGNTYSIRFFTPKQEIPLCGHATLAASKIIFEYNSFETIVFINCENIELPISKYEGKIVMQFPVYDLGPINVPQSVLDALGIQNITTSFYNEKTKIILIEIEDSNVLAKLNPDYSALLKSHSGINGVLVTSVSATPDYDFHYRYFWPWAGTNEDPVTGGVQTFLTKYWATKLHKTELQVYQSSQRSGTMSTALIEDKVFIYGEAVIVFEGDFKN
ncbi:MAG: PhzF family phenazine biosynthesis protein [Saprospiraceae bacterium]|nr:PhzF family phenazine biosynthesis protein [Saprospiraceae bacterium]